MMDFDWSTNFDSHGIQPSKVLTLYWSIWLLKLKTSLKILFKIWCRKLGYIEDICATLPWITGCGEKIFTLQLYIMLRVVWMPQRRVIRRSNGNFVGFPRIILKIVKNYPMKHNSHFSGEWRIWPTRNWNLTLNFEAIWG